MKLNEEQKKYILEIKEKYKNSIFYGFDYMSDLENDPGFYVKTKQEVRDSNGVKIRDYVYDYEYPYYPELLLFFTEKYNKVTVKNVSEDYFKNMCEVCADHFKWDKEEAKKTINQCLDIIKKLKSDDEELGKQ